MYFVTCSLGFERLFHRLIIAAMRCVDNLLPARAF